MNGSKEKNIILRAFRIKNPSPTSSNSGIREKLECELNKVCAKDRSLVLDPNDKHLADQYARVFKVFRPKLIEPDALSEASVFFKHFVYD